jgi:hypothetical protein
MKTIFLITFAICINPIFGQEKFSKEVQDISDKIFKQITGPSAIAKLGTDTANYKVAIVGIENEDGKSTKLTELLENKFAVNLAMNSNGKYDILDRNYIEKLMKEKNIPIEYDNKRDYAKNLGRIKAANFIIVGTLSNFENDFELNIQINETKEGNIIGGAVGNITATQLLKEKNGQQQSNGVKTAQTQTKPENIYSSNNNEVEDGAGNNSNTGNQSRKKGVLSVQNKTPFDAIIYISKEPVDPSNVRASKTVMDMTVANYTSDKYEDLDVGQYYVCAVRYRRQQICVFSKRITIRPNETTQMVISSMND